MCVKSLIASQRWSRLKQCCVSLTSYNSRLHHLKHNRPHSPLSTFTLSTNGWDHMDFSQLVSLSSQHYSLALSWALTDMVLVCQTTNWFIPAVSFHSLSTVNSHMYHPPCDRQWFNWAANQLVSPSNQLLLSVHLVYHKMFRINLHSLTVHAINPNIRILSTGTAILPY